MTQGRRLQRHRTKSCALHTHTYAHQLTHRVSFDHKENVPKAKSSQVYPVVPSLQSCCQPIAASDQPAQFVQEFLASLGALGVFDSGVDGIV